MNAAADAQGAGLRCQAAGGIGTDSPGKVDDLDLRSGREEDRPLDGVAQLSEVARPGIVQDRGLRRRREALDLPAGLAAEEGEEVAGQVAEIGPVAERRQGQLDDVEPIEQIVAEPAGGDLGVQVLVRRRDQPDVRGPGPGLADPLVATLLEEPEQLGLERQGQVGHFVEEQGSSCRRGDLARGVARPRP